MKLLFLTVMPSPYQRQLFAALSDTSGLAVVVRYFTAKAHDRTWTMSSLASYERVMSGGTLAPLGKSAHFNPSVLSEIAAEGPDLTIVSDYSAVTVQVAMRWLSARRRPFVFWGEVPGLCNRGVLGSFVRRRLQEPIWSAAAIAGIGSGAVDAYRGLFPGKPVYNIPYFCDLDPYRHARNAMRARDDDNVDILFSGQLIERKGVDILITAFIAIAHEIPRLRLLLLGGGAQRERFESMVPLALSARVVFLGHRDPSDLPAIYAQADAFCLPSRHDGWGVVVNEALGSGLPIIVSDAVGAGRDLVEDGVNGFVTPAGDVTALAAALRRLASDDTLRSRMASSARDAATRWGLSEGVSRWRRAAEEILDARAMA